MTTLHDIPIFTTGADQTAQAYRKFDHWQKHQHAGCDHETLAECIEAYYTEWFAMETFALSYA